VSVLKKLFGLNLWPNLFCLLFCFVNEMKVETEYVTFCYSLHNYNYTSYGVFRQQKQFYSIYKTAVHNNFLINDATDSAGMKILL
jgi:hypothetical protein